MSDVEIFTGDRSLLAGIGASVEFDWTWEGARAFRPNSLDDDEGFSDRFYEEADCEDEIVWSDECLLVCIERRHARLLL